MAKLHIHHVALVILASLALTEGARRINVQEQFMLRARRSFFGDHSDTRHSRDLLGLTKGEDLEEDRVLPTTHGTDKVKFVETYDGVPIVGATAVLEQDSRGRFIGGSSGHLVTDIDEDIPTTKPRLSINEALKISMRANRHNAEEIRFDEDIDAKLEIVLEDGNHENRPIARLVYRISYMVQTDDDLERPFSLVDADTGDIIKQWNGLSLNRVSDTKPGRVKGAYEYSGVGGNQKIGKASYGKNFPKLKIDMGCMLENNVAKVFSCQGSRCSPKSFSFNCREGFNDSINGAYSPMTDALFYISATYEMFDKWYNISNPLQRKGSTETVCKARVHYGYRYENAFWDGRYITFGDGYNRFYPLTSINVVAHEISHGVTGMNSGLIYSGESGGMNEAFSDMAGEAVEFYATHKQDWMVGYEIFKKPEGALRYFIDPKKDGKSIGNLKEYCSGIDVHYSSGLFNRAFYFLAETEGWDVKKAFTPFVRANLLYWTENSRFYEGACGVVQAAKDLDMNDTDVTAAFQKVGIEPCKDTTRGLIATAALSAPVGHTVRIRVKVLEEMAIDQVTMKIRNRVPVNVQVTSPTCTHCVEKLRGYSTKTFEVCSAKPGIYEMAITPTIEDMWGTSVGIFGALKVIAENITMSGYRAKHHIEFKIPALFEKFELQAMMNLQTYYGYVAGFMRFEEKPDLINYKFDYRLRRGASNLICNPKPGTWHVTIIAYDRRVRGLSLGIQPILTGRRVDVITTAPPPTTAVPTEEGSGGESSGSL